jgi:class 3 adenylate cyclase
MTSNERNGGSTAERLRTATANHWPRLAMAERRQLTVLFVDIVDATS